MKHTVITIDNTIDVPPSPRTPGAVVSEQAWLQARLFHPLCKKLVARALHTSLIECNGMGKIDIQVTSYLPNGFHGECSAHKYAVPFGDAGGGRITDRQMEDTVTSFQIDSRHLQVR